jgi:hypothetical protein
MRRLLGDFQGLIYWNSIEMLNDPTRPANLHFVGRPRFAQAEVQCE